MAFTADEAFALLEKADASQRLAHAYLIAGPEGSSSRELAVRLAGLIVGGGAEPLKHPDVHKAEPESKSRRIVIDQIREMERELQMRSLRGGRKVGIIFHADRLQEQAANAFLKTLEEPPKNTHLLLVTSLPDQLLETILSRCIEVPLRAVEQRTSSERQRRLLEALRGFSKRERADLPGVMGLVREFQSLMAEVKEEAADQAEASFKAESKHYKETSGVTAQWLEGREEYFDALGEARYRSERLAFVETLEQWWADVLRQQSGAENLDLPDYAADTAALAGRLGVPNVLRRAAAIASLRENFGRNVQEQLAVEVAFLEAFAA
jgi:DNA polymerase III subunit delta'